MEAHPGCPSDDHGPDDETCWCLILFTLDDLITVAERERDA